MKNFLNINSLGPRWTVGSILSLIKVPDVRGTKRVTDGVVIGLKTLLVGVKRREDTDGYQSETYGNLKYVHLNMT